MKTLILTIAISLSLVTASTANAATTKGGYPACLSEPLFDEMVNAINRDNQPAINFLLNTGRCVFTRAGLNILVISTTWTGKAKIRIFLGDDRSFIFWTAIENVVD